MGNGKRTPANVYSPPAGICDRLLKFLVNTLTGKRIKHLTLGGGARDSVAIPTDSELLIEFRHIEAKKKKKNDDGRIKTEQFQPGTARMNSHPKKSDSRFRGNPVPDIAVWNRGRGEDDTDRELMVIHHPHRRSDAKKPPAPAQRSEVDVMAEQFIKSRMEAIRKRSFDENKPS